MTFVHDFWLELGFGLEWDCVVTFVVTFVETFGCDFWLYLLVAMSGCDFWL